MRSKVEELAEAHSRLEKQSTLGSSEKDRLVREADEIMRALRKEEDERETVEAQLDQVRNEVRRLQGIAQDRERDVADLQRALTGLEAQGADVSSDKIALELEVERVRRDLARAQEAEARNRNELEGRIADVREKDLRLANMVCRALLSCGSRLTDLTVCARAGLGEQGTVGSACGGAAGSHCPFRQARRDGQGGFTLSQRWLRPC